MARDKYGHYVNEKGVEIKATTDKYGKTHLDFYGSCPADDPNHTSIHLDFDTDTGQGSVVDTSSGDSKPQSVGCYLTSACMKHMQDQFDDNCEELTVLRWFRDKFVSKEDIEHYYKTAPVIVETIDSLEENDSIYNSIYDNVVKPCVEAIKQKNYEFAYKRYKSSVLVLEEEYARPALEEKLVKTLKLAR